MIKLPIFGGKQEWIWVAPRSVATVLETETAMSLVAVLTMWDGSKHTVLDQDRQVAMMIHEAQHQVRSLPPVVTKRKPMV